VSIIGRLDVHRAQITYDWIDTDTGQTRQGQLAPASREHLRGWLERFAGQQAAFAWRAVPAGGMSLRNSGWPGSPRTWPSRPTPARCGATNATPRPTGLTLATSATCSWGVGCPSRGSRRRTCSRLAPRSGCTRPWSTSAPPGSSASMRTVPPRRAGRVRSAGRRAPPAPDQGAGLTVAAHWSESSERLQLGRALELGAVRVNLPEALSYGNHCVVAVSSFGWLIHTPSAASAGWVACGRSVQGARRRRC
jgi:hypothetical protein